MERRRLDEDDEDAKTVLVARRPREAWEDMLAETTTPVAEPVRDDAMLADGSLEDPLPRMRDPMLRVEPHVVALAIGVLFPMLFAVVVLLFA